MIVTRKSPISGVEHSMDINFTDREAELFSLMEEKPVALGMGNKWDVPGYLIQNAFPTQSADVCEFLMTGITPEEWDSIFQDNEGITQEYVETNSDNFGETPDLD